MIRARPPPVLTLDSASTSTYTAKIECSGLTGGLTLNLNGAKVVTSSTTGRTLSVDAVGAGDNDVKVMGVISISSAGEESLHIVRDGVGRLGLDLKKGSTITSSGGSKAIHLWHKGTADPETKGINLVSSAVIGVSGSTDEDKIGILAETADAPAGATIPIRIHLTGGSIRAEGRADRVKGVVVKHVAKGAITITVDSGVMIGLSGKSLGAGAIDVNMDPKGAGNIEITHGGEIYAARGIHVDMQDPGVEGSIKGDIVIKTGAGSKIKTDSNTSASGRGIYPYGIWAHLSGEARQGVIKITHGGMINAAGEGINASGKRGVTITLEKGSSITAKEAGILTASDSGEVTVTHGGRMIDAAGNGIEADGQQGVTITLEKDSSITAKAIGIQANSDSGEVTVTHGGKMIDAVGNGIHAVSTRTVTVELKAGSRITAKKLGINALGLTTGIVMIKMEEDSSIVSDTHGIRVNHTGTKKRKFHVAVHGTVTGGDTCTDTQTGRDKCAGVYVRRSTQTGDKVGGGTIVIGPWAHVKATSGVAIEVDGKAGDVAVILEQDEAGVVGHVKGQIFHPKGADRTPRDKAVEGEVTIKTRSASGTETELKADDATKGIVYRRGDRRGVYEQVFKAQLTELEDKEGYRFVDDTTMDLRLYSHRARLYEVLPSVLLGLVELTPYSTRMAVPRRSTGDEEVMVESSKGEHLAVPGSHTGVWVRLAVRDGERMADTSTTATDFWRQSLAWDVKQTDFEAGLEVPTDDRLVLGVSAHYRQSEATVKRGGTMEASGTGVGVSLTWTDDSGLYVDGQLSYTRFFDITMVSANSAVGAITSTGGGNGLAVGVEVGQPMSMGGMTVIPRGGLSWSSVDMDAFDEPTRIDGAGRVAPDKEQSVQGRVGVLAELGSGEADRRLYASLDLEHEFSSRHAVMVAGTRLATEVKPTWVRLGVGGAMSLGGHDTTLLTGDAFYATAGSDNTDFGGGLSVTFRF